LRGKILAFTFYRTENMNPQPPDPTLPNCRQAVGIVMMSIIVIIFTIFSHTVNKLRK